MKVVAVSDKIGTAIDRLCRGVAKYHDNLEYIVCDVHPKRPSKEQLERFDEAIKDADIIDYQYFRSADMLRERYVGLENIPSILTHNNPYSIHERDWADYDIVVANNLTMEADLSTITPARLEYIPLTVDADFWTFNQEYKPKDQVIMVANRIESKKGILEVAIACAELKVKLVLVGAISDTNYFNDIMACGNVDFYEQVSDEKLKQLYFESKLHVCNSKDDFESGTLPILEAMLCGTPVLTRDIGHVPDLYNGSNMLLIKHSNEDVVALIETLKQALDSDTRDDIRDKAWQTAKTRNNERRAFGYQKLYRSLVDDKKTVSVIVPVYDKPETIKKCLEGINNQTYKNIEIIVVNDNHGQNGLNASIARDYKSETKYPIRYINSSLEITKHTTAESGQPAYKLISDYGLARARNKGIIEATGDVLVFCDQRMIMDKMAVEKFVDNIKPRTWLYGNKGVKKDFVENFSCVYRDDLIRIGMFCERMDIYGGLSQETRSRAKYNGFSIEYIESAKAEPMGKSGNKHSKKQEIIKSKNRLWKMGMEL